MGKIVDNAQSYWGKPYAQKRAGSTVDGVKGAVIYTQYLGAVAAASATAVVTGGAADATTANAVSATFATPRAVQVVLSGAGTEVVNVTGLDTWGQSQTEALTLNGATPVIGKIAFASVSQWQMASAAAAGRTINIGSADVLGLDHILTSTGDVIAENVDGVNQNVTATGTKKGTFVIGSASANADDRGTYAPESGTNAPNGTKVFTIHYAVQDLTGNIDV